MTSDIQSVPLCYLRDEIALNDRGSPGFSKTGTGHPSSDLWSKLQESIILNLIEHIPATIYYICCTIMCYAMCIFLIYPKQFGIAYTHVHGNSYDCFWWGFNVYSFITIYT